MKRDVFECDHCKKEVEQWGRTIISMQMVNVGRVDVDLHLECVVPWATAEVARLEKPRSTPHAAAARRA